MSADPFSRDELAELRRQLATALPLAEIGLGGDLRSDVALRTMQRLLATVQAADAELDDERERAERAEALLRAWGISLDPVPDLMAALKESLAADREGRA